MAVKVVESVEPEAIKLEKIDQEPVVNTLPSNTLWVQVEQTLSNVRKLQEHQEDAYINGIKEIIKFNKQYRKSLVSLYRQTRKTNSEMVKGMLTNVDDDKAKEEVDIKPKQGEFAFQVKEVYSVFEKIALTPYKSVFGIINVLEENIEKGAETYVSYARKRRNALQQVTNKYVAVAKNTTHKLIDRN